MKNIKIFLASFTAFVFLSNFTAFADDTNYREYESKTNADIMKSFEVKFSGLLDPLTINGKNIYVVDSSGNKVDTVINQKFGFTSQNGLSDTVVIKPLINYQPDNTYTLVISTGVRSILLKPLKQCVKMNFTTCSMAPMLKAYTHYDIGGVDKDGFNIVTYDKTEFNNEYKNNSGYTSIMTHDIYKDMPKLSISFTNAPNISEAKTNEFMWMPEVEKAVVDEINKRRTAQGLNEVVKDNNLVAMARWCAHANMEDNGWDDSINTLAATNTVEKTNNFPDEINVSKYPEYGVSYGNLNKWFGYKCNNMKIENSYISGDNTSAQEVVNQILTAKIGSSVIYDKNVTKIGTGFLYNFFSNEDKRQAGFVIMSD
jgi:hypothetical protein